MPGRTKILIVEDEALIRWDLRKSLEDAGYSVSDVPTADDAARLLTDGDDFHILCADIRTPGKLDGLDLAKLVREVSPTVQIILISGEIQVRDIPEDVADAYFVKPLTVSRLLKRIEQLVKERDSGK